jgi:hypothetical protein
MESKFLLLPEIRARKKRQPADFSANRRSRQLIHILLQKKNKWFPDRSPFPFVYRNTTIRSEMPQ